MNAHILPDYCTFYQELRSSKALDFNSVDPWFESGVWYAVSSLRLPAFSTDYYSTQAITASFQIPTY
jgi:hypothetical protein